MSARSATRRKKPDNSSSVETCLAAFVQVPLARLQPAILNDKIYKRVDPDDPTIHSLADRMRRLRWRGAMAVTQGWGILSGHRRRAAPGFAGTSVGVVPL